jgi:hypothetical protein
MLWHTVVGRRRKSLPLISPCGFLGFGMLRMLDIKIDYRDGLIDFNYDPNRLHHSNRLIP